MLTADPSVQEELLALNQAARQAPLQAASWHRLAVALNRAGRTLDAVAPASNAVQLQPVSLEHRLLLADLLALTGDHPSALAHYELALRLYPDDPKVLSALAGACRAIGLAEDAMRLHRRILASHPGYPGSQESLESLATQPAARPSVTAYAEAQKFAKEAEDWLARGQPLQALHAYRRCAQLVPGSAVVYYWIGSVLHDMARAEQGLACYELALRIDPNLYPAANNAGRLAASLGLPDRAQPHLRQAQRLRPNPGQAVRLELLLEAIPESVEHIAQLRQGFSASLDRILERPPQIADPLDKAGGLGFYLAYHGLGNRELLSKLARVNQAMSPELAWTAPHLKQERRGGTGRIKIGFISQFMRRHSIGKTTRGLIAQLSRERFEVYVINIPPVVLDDWSRWIKDRADHWITLADGLAQAREQLAALQLDILFYQDIGMEPFSYFLAFARLAPVQCVSFGHPDTTGIPNIDYFISSDLYEVEGASEHYSEKLVQLHNLPSLAYYYRPERRGWANPRAQLGLTGADHIYLCPQTLFKLHPDFDQLMAGILERDGHGRVLVISAQCAEWAVRVQRRFARRHPQVSERIQFLPPRDLDGFLGLLAAADVVLDTVHFNGMNTSLEAFSVGTPVVTLPGELQRSRHTQAMYRCMGVEGCVAADVDGYIDIAVRLASDAERRRKVHELILQRNEALYQDDNVVRQLEGFFEEAHQASAGRSF